MGLVAAISIGGVYGNLQEVLTVSFFHATLRLWQTTVRRGALRPSAQLRLARRCWRQPWTAWSATDSTEPRPPSTRTPRDCPPPPCSTTSRPHPTSCIPRSAPLSTSPNP